MTPLTGKAVTLLVDANRTIHHVKRQYAKAEDMSPEEIRLIFRGPDLQDDKTVADYGIQDDCCIAVGLHLLHHGSFEFPDMSGGTASRDWSITGSRWYRGGPGLMLIGICRGTSCEAKGQRVIHWIREPGTFVVNADDATCPECGEEFKPFSAGFSRCEWRYEAKFETERDRVDKVESPWITADEYFNELDASEENMKMYYSLKITTRNVTTLDY